MSTTPLPTPTAAEIAFELEKSAITSYEEGWDRWDGPIYPIGYIQCRMQEDGYVAPKFQDAKVKGVEVKMVGVSAD
ncbi:hypothetical protein G6011_01949 [Alternaria panax]|uniref:Uncharacterized protein n=1 Tax=Alternaria panax TaxID=48097 RepID=A0AAD4FFY2_9PLEO|nr:hypothetical protein G6011_01949 [Alternaria panax]